MGGEELKKGKLKKVGLEAPEDLVNAIQEAWRAKRRYKGRQFSNRLAYEIGAKVLLEIDDDEEEEVLNQRINDIALEMALLESRKKLLTDKKEKRAADKIRREADADKERQLKEVLASKIREYWEKITVLNQTEYIGYIVNLSPERLTREKVSAIFPRGYSPAPDEESSINMAITLLGGVF